jgi:hypothetical protein
LHCSDDSGWQQIEGEEEMSDELAVAVLKARIEEAKWWANGHHKSEGWKGCVWCDRLAKLRAEQLSGGNSEP